MVGAAALLLRPGPGRAQGVTVFPAQRPFASPLADPLEPRFAIGLLVTDLLGGRGPERDPFSVARADARDVQAAASIGGTIPLLQLLDRPAGGIVVGAQAGVFARFRIEVPSRDDLGQDWIVGLPIEAWWKDVSGRLRIVHRSAHIGDEFSVSTGAERIEFGGETLDLLTGVRLGRLRAYGGGGWTFHSNTDNTDVLRSEGRSDRFAAQAGIDGRWPAAPAGGLALVAGLDWQSAERTAWRSAFALAAGLEYRYDGRSAQLVFRWLDGVSPMGQFFLTRERYGSLELVLGF
jgi:hypothetical protein